MWSNRWNKIILIKSASFSRHRHLLLARIYLYTCNELLNRKAMRRIVSPKIKEAMVFDTLAPFPFPICIYTRAIIHIYSHPLLFIWNAHIIIVPYHCAAQPHHFKCKFLKKLCTCLKICLSKKYMSCHDRRNGRWRDTQC